MTRLAKTSVAVLFAVMTAGAGPALHAEVVYTAQSGVGVVAIDPTTGATTTIAPINSLTIQLGSAFDASTRRLFLRVGATPATTMLLTLFVDTGVTTQVPAPNMFAFLEYDASTGKVYTAQSGVGVVAIDPGSGATTTVASINSLTIQLGSAFDVSTRRLFLRVGVTPATTMLLTLFVDTGVTTQVPAPNTFAFLEYDASTGKVYTAQSGVGVVAIDPNSGATTTVVSNLLTIQLGSAFDASTRRLFLRVGATPATATLTTLLATNGSTTQVPAPNTFAFLEFSSVTANVPALQIPAVLLLAAFLAVAGILRTALR